MPLNGSGSYSSPASTWNPAVSNTTINSTDWAALLADLSTALSTAMYKDGQATPTANLPMGGFKLTGLAAGNATGNSVRYEQFFPTFNTTGPVNETKTTVASASSPDIWTSVGNVVDYTGTVTATGFAAAPQAGARRTLVCAGAAPFTAGANLLIQGYASGSTFTAAAGDLIDVVAITTTQFRLTIRNASGLPVVGTSVPRNYIAGLTLNTAGSSATMSIAAGQAADSTNADLMTLSSSISKTTSAWAVGTGNGGLDTGSIANSTWYHFYEIKRPDTQVVDVLFSVSASAPTMPANYTLKRRIGAGLTNGSAQWVAFVQDGDLFTLSATVEDISAANPGTGAVTRTMGSIPLGIRVRGIFQAQARSVTTGTTITGLLSDLSASSESMANDGSTAGNFWYQAATASQATGAQVEVMTNTSQQIRSIIGFSDANVVLHIRTRGWYDSRGKDA